MRGQPHRYLAALVVSLAVVVAACSSPQPRPDPQRASVAVRWQPVSLPGYSVEAVTAHGGRLLVGARETGSTARAALFLVDRRGRTTPVPLRATSTYAAGARWKSLASDGSRIVALGGAVGGAHSITRWTVWSGGADQVVEHPQPFETFGGPRAAGLADVALGGAGAVVVGGWEGADGRLDVAVWREPAPGRWERSSSAGTALASTARRQLVAGGAAATSDGVVLLGSVVELGGPDIREAPVVWAADGEGPWTARTLPATQSSASAHAAACDDVACWVTGHDGEDLALWRTDAEEVDRVVLPVRAPATSAVAAPALWRGAVHLPAADRDILVRSSSGRWTTMARPPGTTVLALVAAEGALFARTTSGGGAGLWVTSP